MTCLPKITVQKRSHNCCNISGECGLALDVYEQVGEEVVICCRQRYA